ncbi:hypothetical protein BpHYR1_013832 [Brachionus plicatilis]|uniref:Uncharacterized protein n=1 Tax=Brachionus plicatilis TaxID=10195 RepID=A0A3M7PQV7_BRAPC|nr:hypothetical protein BpHYR1_013832 [Brachionus plicatilis]
MILFSLLLIKPHLDQKKLSLPNTRDINFYQIQTCFLNRPASRKKLDVGKDAELKIYKNMLDEN